MAFELVYLNGRCVPAHQAAVSVFDAGFLYGASTFTSMLASGGVVFRLDRHLERLMDTVGVLGLRVGASAESLTAAVKELIQRDQVDQAKVRLMLTPGSTLPDETGQPAPPTTLITAEPIPAHYQQWRQKGITVAVSSIKQASGDPVFGHKTGCYLPRYLAFREAAEKGAQEALWFTADNRLAEACFRNVFLVQGGKLFTPPTDTPCLPGIVRQAILDLCRPLGIEADQQTPLTVREMLDADEIFLTGSVLGVCPVVRIERHAVGNDSPGPVTQRLAAAYWDLVAKECGKR